MSLTVRFLGSGDAFGSGGRLQACILVDSGSLRLLLDCGDTSLVAMRQQGVQPNDIDAVLLTHMHGDHCAGVPYLLMEAMLPGKRTRPLLVAGPRGCPAHLEQLREALFPGSRVMNPRFPYRVVELEPGARTGFEGFTVSAYPARHTAETNPLILRLECGERVITYSGDTEWTDALALACRGADLLITECYFHDKPVRMHLDYATLAAHRHELGARRIVLTHMSAQMLRKVDAVAEQCARDGLVLEV